MVGGVSAKKKNLQLRSSKSVSKEFGLAPFASRLYCSFQDDIKDFAQNVLMLPRLLDFSKPLLPLLS
uniref:Uncharacterized protein n=1 Tax=Solanum lycopersicum TaxID=4081 RepID=A0A3Q7GT00_SOLLC